MMQYWHKFVDWAHDVWVDVKKAFREEPQMLIVVAFMAGFLALYGIVSLIN